MGLTAKKIWFFNFIKNGVNKSLVYSISVICGSKWVFLKGFDTYVMSRWRGPNRETNLVFHFYKKWSEQITCLFKKCHCWLKMGVPENYVGGFYLKMRVFLNSEIKAAYHPA